MYSRSHTLCILADRAWTRELPAFFGTWHSNGIMSWLGRLETGRLFTTFPLGHVGFGRFGCDEPCPIMVSPCQNEYIHWRVASSDQPHDHNQTRRFTWCPGPAVALNFPSMISTLPPGEPRMERAIAILSWKDLRALAATALAHGDNSSGIVP